MPPTLTEGPLLGVELAVGEGSAGVQTYFPHSWQLVGKTNVHCSEDEHGGQTSVCVELHSTQLSLLSSSQSSCAASN